MRPPSSALAAVVAAAALIAPAGAAGQGDTRVQNASPPGPFSQNKQNEPAVVVDQSHPDVAVAGANDEIDEEACNSGDPRTCPFTPGVGVSGVSFSFDGGQTWRQPQYTGVTARHCQTPRVECTPKEGPIGTLPRYDEAGLVSDGDPALAFGPVYRNGRFSWSYGSRLYYASLASALEGNAPFRGYEAITVSRTDDPARAAAGDESAWRLPVVATKQSSSTFQDKEQIWADNVSRSRYFGYVYICNASFRSNSRGYGIPVPIVLSRSTDGGATWSSSQISSSTANPTNAGRDGCTVRTDSRGVVYVMWRGEDPRTHQEGQILTRSFDGGRSFEKPRRVTGPAGTVGVIDPVILRPVEDGLAGARADLAPAPSLDVANGAPSGADATDELVLTWVDGSLGLNRERALLSTSRDQGRTWSGPVRYDKALPSQAADRPYYAAAAISPDGTDLYLTYNAFTTPFRNDTSSPRRLLASVLQTDLSAAGVPTGGFRELHRSAPGDPRGSSQNNLVAEFLGDYVYASASRDRAAAVWNDVRNAGDCPAIDRYRAAYAEAVRAGRTSPAAEEDGPAEAHRAQAEGEKPGEADGGAPEPPVVQAECPATFGNTDIYGGRYTDPTP